MSRTSGCTQRTRQVRQRKHKGDVTQEPHSAYFRRPQSLISYISWVVPTATLKFVGNRRIPPAVTQALHTQVHLSLQCQQPCPKHLSSPRLSSRKNLFLTNNLLMQKDRAYDGKGCMQKSDKKYKYDVGKILRTQGPHDGEEKH